MKRKNRGITLIALVITIIILLILAGISISLITGENGLIAKARLTVFITEMQGIKESVKLKQVENLSDSYTSGTKTDLFEKKFNANEFDILDSLKKEILYGRAGLPEDGSPEDYDAQDFDSLLDADGNVEGIYIIDKVTGNGKEDTYIYDEETDMVFKIPATSIAGKVYHSYETAVKGKGGQGSDGGTGSGGFIQDESIVEKVGDIYYYWPNLKGFNGKKTYVIYYSEDFTKTEEVTAEEYMANGQQRQIEGKDGGTYTLHDYQHQIWANIKTTSGGQESWWVWIPRYAYKITDQTVDIEYIGDNDLPLDPEKTSLEDGYETHSAFDTKDGKKLKGIWMSKYEPDYGEYQGSNKVLAPDMSGFDKENTYIELYDKGTNKFEEVKLSEANLNSINNDNRWYDYKNQIWANIKTVANGQEAWWIWIPRFAYNILLNTTTNPILEPIFVDTQDKPLDSEYGTKLSSMFSVHPAFNTEDGKKLSGIWISKYEPSYGDISYIGNSNNILEPNINGFDKDNTYIVYYSEDLTETKNVPLADYISNGKRRQIQDGGKTFTFYDYPNKIWANIKTVANNQEAWWVWIPRFAYNALESTSINSFGIIFVNTENKPIDSKYGTELLKDIYKVHPAFTTKEGEELEGIWMSKYEPNDSTAQ